jgi:hypothetical protein
MKIYAMAYLSSLIICIDWAVFRHEDNLLYFWWGQGVAYLNTSNTVEYRLIFGHPFSPFSVVSYLRTYVHTKRQCMTCIYNTISSLMGALYSLTLVNEIPTNALNSYILLY